MPRLVEPFAGSAALTLACATRQTAREFWINDLNKPLADLFTLVVNRPEELADAYHDVWRAQATGTLEHYYRVRDEFNRHGDPQLFLYLLARCVKGAVRYNRDGLFNQSPDKRRRGTRPESMRASIMAASSLLRGRTIVTARDYREVLANLRRDDVVYMDPPYQGVCGDRDARYASRIAFDDFAAELDELCRRGVRFLVSYDGRTDGKTYGRPLPDRLGLRRVELEAGRSSQATLLGREAITVESLYLSAALVEQLERDAVACPPAAFDACPPAKIAR